MNVFNRNTAAANVTASQEAALPTPDQVTGGTIQGYADRGLQIDPTSPAVTEALRRRQVPLQQINAQNQYRDAFSSPDPLGVLFGILSKGTNPASYTDLGF
jgi:hypothetical protein